ncbi:MAG: flagellar biosynthetic protein FliR [Myxococcota bacterium]
MTVAWVTGGLVFARLSALLLTLPMISTVGVPKYVSILLAVALAVLVSPGVPMVEEATLQIIVLGFAGEIMLGASLGLVVRASFAAFAVAAEMLARQTAMGMSSSLDPVMSLGQSSLGILASWMAGLVFVGSNQHHRVLEIVAASFHRVPPGQLADIGDLADALTGAVEVTIIVGVQLSGPLVALVFLVNVFIGILAKLAPRMNVFFSVGMTVNSVVGIWLFGIALPWMLDTHHETVEASIQTVMGLVLGATP